MKETNEFNLFSRSRINTIIGDLSQRGSAAERVPITDADQENK